MPDRDYWGSPYDGARHPDKSDPSAHDDVHPVAWRERQAQRCRYPSCDCDGPEGPACGLPGYAEAMHAPILEGATDDED